MQENKGIVTAEGVPPFRPSGVFFAALRRSDAMFDCQYEFRRSRAAARH
jgi:hypothetical protein